LFQSDDKRRIVVIIESTHTTALVVARKRCFSPSLSSFQDRIPKREDIIIIIRKTAHNNNNKKRAERGDEKHTRQRKKKREREATTYHSCELAYFNPSMTVEYARCPKKPTLLESAGAKAKEPLGLLESAVEDANRFKECLSAIFVFRVFFFFFF
tara:strand:+ start:2156 stop:2620 length:465 start_codon:yes stop_codon:yes gene_type:complete